MHHHQPDNYLSPPPPPPPYYHYHQPPPPPTPTTPIDPHHPSPPPSYASAPPFAAAPPPPDFSTFPYPSPFPDPIPPDPHSIYSSTPPPHLNSPTPPFYTPSYDPQPQPQPQPLHYPNPNSNPNYGYDYGPGYPHDDLTSYGSNYGPDLYKDDGVYAYQGKSDPYGARSVGPKPSSWSGMFDDYGRAIGFPSEEKKKSSFGSGSGSGSMKVVRAVPKVEEQSDVKSGVQKFRVKLIPESGGQSVMDVLCMVGLDGIRMLDPNTSRTLRIYPLDTITRCDKFDSSTFAFWSKTSVDSEPRRIRLQSNSYTTNTILDTVTAATIQFKEMGGRIRPSESVKAPEQPADKKKGFVDWINRLKPVYEEKDHWVPDEVVSNCTGCGSDFSAFNRRHHCRNCGDVFCDKCTQGRTPLTSDDSAQPARVCDRCMAEVTRRLSKAKEAASRPVTLQSHEDLAKKLQEEMEKNLRISSSGSKSEGSERRLREVACPTCTVHLQVQVPSSGSETIECGVCQNPFLVSAH